MIKDKFSATWVSHSSINDYLRCPRGYYLNNVYKDPKTFHKISLMQPAKALGQVVHQVIDVISILPVEERFKSPLITKFNEKWEKVKGIKGGFKTRDEEYEYRARGEKMISKLENNPGPLVRKAIKIRQELPYYWLSDKDNIILCGKIDWLEYLEEADGVRIIDFKTGKYDEDPDSLQLPIYHLLVKNTQSKDVLGAQYWYLERDEAPTDVKLPSLKVAHNTILEIAKKIALARKLERFTCKLKDGCSSCKPLEAVIAGKAKFIGIDNYKQDVYVL